MRQNPFPQMLGQMLGLWVLPIAIASLTSPSALAQTDDPASEQTSREADRRRLAAEQEQLRLEEQNLRLRTTELELQKKLLNLEQQQLGLSENSRAIGLDKAQAGTSFEELKVVPIESKILVFQSSGQIVDTIAQEILKVSADSEIQSLVVYSQSEFAKVNGYRLYNNIRKGLVAAYKDAGIELDLPRSTDAPGGTRGGLEGISGGLQASTTALRSAAELLSYFRSEEVIFPNSFKPEGQDFLVAQLVSALRKKQSKIQVYSPSIYLMNFEQSNNPIELFLDELNELALLQEKAKQAIEKSSDRRQIERWQQLNLQADLLLNLLKAADFQSESQPKGEESSGGAQIFQLIQGAQISQLLNNQKKRVLVLDLLESGGSSRTRRSLFTTMFTGQSVSYSGGAAVQYFLVNPDNSLAAGNVIYRSSGFKSMRRARGN